VPCPGFAVFYGSAWRLAGGQYLANTILFAKS
jgi:hypothetical protein